MTPSEIARLRLGAQRVSAPRFQRPDEVVSWLGAVQAQDYLGALWAVGLRMESAREADVERALAEGTIVRTWPMRGTLHFVASADARWMVELLAPRRISGAASRFRQLGLDDATFTKARRVLEKRLATGPVSRPRVYEALEEARIGAAGQRGLHILWRLAHETLICFGPREGKQPTFVLFDAWLPGAKGLPRDEALATLAVRYFRGHGPATEADFAWWSGLPRKDVRSAIAAAGRSLRKETMRGKELWLDARVTAPRSADEPAVLLPAFDELLVAFADRSAMIDPKRYRSVNAGGGILKPVMVVGHRVVGTWQRRLARGRVRFAPSPFGPLDKPTRAAVTAAFARYAAFLGLDAEVGRGAGRTR
ncbi:MAG TPA: winged helix DNA-binding domain-containing protein [Polyangiaceae bacterium]|jgi:hypothetical protein